MIMNLKLLIGCASVTTFCGSGVAVEMPSVKQLAEIRSQRTGAEMRAKAMPIVNAVYELRHSASKQEKIVFDKRMSDFLLDAPPAFCAKDDSLALRTQFVKTMPEFAFLQPDARLWNALADHLHVVTRISRKALDVKMSEAKMKDDKLIAEGKITRPPCHFGYPNTPNMAAVLREKWAADNWNVDIAMYRMALLGKYKSVLDRHLQDLDMNERKRFRRLFTARARLTPDEEVYLFGSSSVASGMKKQTVQ